MHVFPATEFNDLTALHWLSRFGWLRARELGALMWPKPNSAAGVPLKTPALESHQRWMANRLLRRLREQKLVLSRTLPKKGGTAIVLSVSGARYLQHHLNITVRHGDKWGRTYGGTWLAPTSWEHELLVTLVLLRFITLGAEVKTELEIRAENTGHRKYPDGLVRYSTKHKGEKVEVVNWIEVESADKSGAKMLALAKTLTLVQRGLAPVLSGWTSNTPIVVYRDDMKDLTGKPIDHKNRITSAIRRHIGANLSIYFQRVKFKNASYHIEQIQSQPATIAPFDLEDPDQNLSKTAFSATKHKVFINTSIDRRGKEWKLKVYFTGQAYRYEIWSPEPEFPQNPQPVVMSHDVV